MQIFDWPANVYPIEVDGQYCDVVPINQRSASSRTGAVQRISIGPGALWMMQARFITAGEDEEAPDKLLMDAKGGRHIIRAPNLIHEGVEQYRRLRGEVSPYPATSLSGAVNKGAATLSLTINSGSQRKLKVGTPVQIGTRLYKSRNNGMMTPGQSFTLQVYPVLRASHLAGEAVIFNRPVGHWMLDDDQAVIGEYQYNDITARALSFSEDFTAI